MKNTDGPNEEIVKKMSTIKFDAIGDLGVKTLQLYKESGVEGIEAIIILNTIMQTLQSNLDMSAPEKMTKEDFVKLTQESMEHDGPEEIPEDDKKTEEQKREEFFEWVYDECPLEHILDLISMGILLGVRNRTFNYDKVRALLIKMEEKFPPGT